MYMGLRRSGDESKILFISDERIEAWSMWTWETVGKKLRLERSQHLDCLSICSSGVQIPEDYPSAAQEGWDLALSLSHLSNPQEGHAWTLLVAPVGKLVVYLGSRM